MRIPISFLLAIATCLFLTSCSSLRVQKELVCRFLELQDAGKIPGLPRDTRGEFRTQGTRLKDRITYPLAQTIYLTKEQDAARYSYTFMKDTSASEWRLTAAWRTLPDGQQEDLKIQ